MLTEYGRLPARRWTGATRHVTSVTTATALVHMAGQDLTVTATYKLDPTLDTDADGMLDSWELTNFNNLSLTPPFSDSDGDGFTDSEEFLAGTNPTDPHSHLQVVEVTTGANGVVNLRRDAVAGKTCTLLQRTDLLTGTWAPSSAGIPGGVPFCKQLPPALHLGATGQFPAHFPLSPPPALS